MSVLIIFWAVVGAQVLLACAMVIGAYRMLFGPKAQDRVLGLDNLYLNATMLLLTFGIRYSSTHYFEAALVIAMLGFVATAALAKVLMRGEVIE
ncbi:K+/H+ antiporter subunit F [Microvirga sp. W0021]|uniref:K+/H+ antiporter subunit F n=1 Tax=Hohaiivirga grylli TaxID=3133970 RepID=A0ABV0BNQ5_9HYPH